ncbi:MAG: triphosphoribosyl-dephospho-CoA synthase MdcB [Sphingobacteriales bacterium]|nr:MAG: triphosphoribosyl-dephospho-CoA synthase MdcB [Sphingobacteriales bacterium]
MIMNNPVVAEELAQQLSAFAVEALMEELHLTPKPGLVDRSDNGNHRDLSLPVMEISAYTLKECFYEMAIAGVGKKPSQQLRERLAAIGRYGEETMLKATRNINTHRGAIWALGLLTGAAGILLSASGNISLSRYSFLITAGAVASFDDRYAPIQHTHGSKVRKMYLVRSAREEAMANFPSLQHAALPTWDKYQQEPENILKLNVLLSLMAVTDDTCILYRSDLEVLCEIKQRAREIMDRGGMACGENWQLYYSLDRFINEKWVSPGGSADLLAATLFLQKIIHHYKIK